MTSCFKTAVYFVEGVIYILAGVLGVSAVCLDSTRAAKVYMFSWPVKFAFGVWTMLELFSSMKKYGMAQQGHVVTLMFSNIIFLLYFFKVCTVLGRDTALAEEPSFCEASSFLPSFLPCVLLDGLSPIYTRYSLLLLRFPPGITVVLPQTLSQEHPKRQQ